MRLEDVELVRSRRKTVALEVKAPGRVIVRAPLRMAKRDIVAFVQEHADWIDQALAKAQAREEARQAEAGELLTDADIRKLAAQAKVVIPERLAWYAPRIGVTYGRITLRIQKTRWGSCSSKGNLNFNVLLMLAPSEVLDYVVVHELCHRLEMNHSPRFWALVERFDPQFRAHKLWLKEHGGALLAKAGRE